MENNSLSTVGKAVNCDGSQLNQMYDLEVVQNTRHGIMIIR